LKALEGHLKGTEALLCPKISGQKCKGADPDEGMEKRSENFAEEVAKQVNGE